MLIGQDNRGIRGASADPAKEPGNQMAGFELRLVSPFQPLPIALYAQEIGEDSCSSGIPERYLGLFGGEMWFMLRTGSVLRAHVEYANTKVEMVSVARRLGRGLSTSHLLRRLPLPGSQ